MSGETEKDVSGWTVDTLHTYVFARLRDMRELMDERTRHAEKAVGLAFENQQTAMAAALAAAEKAVTAALTSAEKAVAKAELSTEKRIEGLNELRRVVNDISALQMPRAEAEQRIAQVDSGLDELKERLTQMVSVKQGGKEQLASIYALVAFLVTVLVLGTALAAAGVFSN